MRRARSNGERAGLLEQSLLVRIDFLSAALLSRGRVQVAYGPLTECITDDRRHHYREAERVAQGATASAIGSSMSPGNERKTVRLGSRFCNRPRARRSPLPTSNT